MDLNFSCPSCRQELTADDSMIGREIACPACNEPIIIQDQSRIIDFHSGTGRVALHSTGGAGKELIQKPNPPLEVTAKAGIKARVKTIRRGDCLADGKDRFDETVTDFLASIGDVHAVTISPIQYTHVDAETKQPATDYGVLIVYRG
jgi:DNA-directed RNA polymerase subunit RPC12/RpoP